MKNNYAIVVTRRLSEFSITVHGYKKCSHPPKGTAKGDKGAVVTRGNQLPEQEWSRIRS